MPKGKFTLLTTWSKSSGDNDDRDVDCKTDASTGEKQTSDPHPHRSMGEGGSTNESDPFRTISFNGDRHRPPSFRRHCRRTCSCCCYPHQHPRNTAAITPRLARIVLPASAILTGLGVSSASAMDSTASSSTIAATTRTATTTTTALPASSGKPQSPFRSSLNQYFPGAIPNTEVASSVISTLRRRMDSRSKTRVFTGGGKKRTERIIFGTSVCPDELNSDGRSLSFMLARRLVSTRNRRLSDNYDTGIFPLGGLGGIPFVGISGVDAFLHHAPKNGHVFVLFGPHVGITSTQGGGGGGVQIGKVERIGLNQPSMACGAAVGAYKTISAEKQKNGGKNEVKNTGNTENGEKGFDYEEEYIISKLRPRLEKRTRGDDGNGMIANVTYMMYKLIADLLMGELDACTRKSSFWSGVSTVTLLGGIIINQGRVDTGGRKVQDYFQPLLFESWAGGDESSSVGSSPVKHDLYVETFGSEPPIVLF